MAASNAAAQKKKKKGMNGQFFHDVKVEMKKVIWPTKKEMITYTVMQAPIVNTVNVLQGNIRNLVYALNAVREAKEQASA